MQQATPFRAMIARTSLIVLATAVSGCTALLPDPAEPVADEPIHVPASLPLPDPQPEVQPEPSPPPPQPIPAAEPVPVPEPDPVPVNVGPLVAVVISDRTPAYVGVADALSEHLDNQEVYDLSDGSLTPETAFEAIGRTGAVAVVAIGLPAAKAASSYSTLPTVVGQVFNFIGTDLESPSIRSVSTLPPIARQIDAWLTVDPQLRNVGAIVGPGHDSLLKETEIALSEHGIKLHYAIASSDRETLYLFNRLVGDIDGFLLFPDNRVLSLSVLTEMMDYAARHRVQVAVFNDPLLELGAVMSTAAIDADIAAAITMVLNRIVAGDLHDVPQVSPLSAMHIRTNPDVIRKLGLVVSPALNESVADAQ